MKKILSLILTVVMVCSLVACGNSTTSTSSSSSSSTGTEKLIMCTNAEFPPYEYKEGGDFKGIDVEIANKIGEKLGCEIEILDIAFDSLIPTVNSGKADFAMAGMTITEDRKENVDFTDTYQNAVQAIIVPINSEIVDSNDMYDKKIGVQLGTTGDIYCTDDFGDENISRYPKIVDGVQAMKTGSIDACVVDDQVAKAVVAGDEGSFKILESPYAEEEYAIAVKKGNSELLDKLNGVIKEMKSNGELKAIVDKYIQ
ncbi:MAG: basic amino acid ABC transporter substrate-binding protein [Lachnospiraceae bacterium]|nr:basic amino acid ABC transporter substrate-binding protein [Lachnospiraceae bacterium]